MNSLFCKIGVDWSPGESSQHNINHTWHIYNCLNKAINRRNRRTFFYPSMEVFTRFSASGASVVFFQYGAWCSDVFDYFCCNLWFSECKRTKRHYIIKWRQLDGHAEGWVDGGIVRNSFFLRKQKRRCHVKWSHAKPKQKSGKVPCFMKLEVVKRVSGVSWCLYRHWALTMTEYNAGCRVCNWSIIGNLLIAETRQTGFFA